MKNRVNQEHDTLEWISNTLVSIVIESIDLDVRVDDDLLLQNQSSNTASDSKDPASLYVVSAKRISVSNRLKAKLIASFSVLAFRAALILLIASWSSSPHSVRAGWEKCIGIGRDVAIRVLRKELGTDPERLRRFEQEARSASSLNHPNIITVHDICLRHVSAEGSGGRILMRDRILARPDDEAAMPNLTLPILIVDNPQLRDRPRRTIR